MMMMMMTEQHWYVQGSAAEVSACSDSYVNRHAPQVTTYAASSGVAASVSLMGVDDRLVLWYVGFQGVHRCLCMTVAVGCCAAVQLRGGPVTSGLASLRQVPCVSDLVGASFAFRCRLGSVVAVLRIVLHT
jgi:hypothetical protein